MLCFPLPPFRVSALLCRYLSACVELRQDDTRENIHLAAAVTLCMTLALAIAAPAAAAAHWLLCIAVVVAVAAITVARRCLLSRLFEALFDPTQHLTLRASHRIVVAKYALHFAELAALSLWAHQLGSGDAATAALAVVVVSSIGFEPVFYPTLALAQLASIVVLRFSIVAVANPSVPSAGSRGALLSVGLPVRGELYVGALDAFPNICDGGGGGAVATGVAAALTPVELIAALLLVCLLQAKVTFLPSSSLVPSDFSVPR